MTKQIARGLTIGASLMVSALTLAGFLGTLHWTLDVITHFTLQLTIFSGALLVVGLLMRVPHWVALATGLSLTINAMVLAPYYVPTPVASATQREPLQLATINIHTATRDFTRLGEFLRRDAPDVVLFVEATPPLIRYLSEHFGRDFPYVYDESTNGTLGFAVLSRLPFQDIQTVPLEGRRRRFIRTEIVWDGQPVTLFGIHPLPALGTRWAARRDAELDALADLVAAESGPLVVLGDFNAAPWSAPMRRWSDLPLQPAAHGFGIAPTCYLPGSIPMAPLDYILVSPHWRVIDYRLGASIGSDHLPVTAELQLR